MKDQSLLRTLAVVGAAFLGIEHAASGARYYVSPQGSDEAEGTLEKPFASLRRARDAARQTGTTIAKHIVVREGNYYDVCLVLGPEDSGLNIEAAAGERPVLYGGQPITDWVPEEGPFWAAPLPELPPVETDPAGNPTGRLPNWQVRMLLVDGKTAPQARLPAAGRYIHSNVFNVRWMSSTGGGWQRKPSLEELTRLDYQPGDVPASLEVENAEITVYHMWDESRVGLARHHPDQQRLVFSSPCGHPPGAFGVREYVLWNIREGMTAPGQWYHDRLRGRLIYWPLPGQDMTRLEVIVPTRTAILHLRGRANRAVQGVHVRGLTFSVSSVPLEAAGFAAAKYGGAIELEHAEGCTFQRLKIAHVAGHGINTRGRIAAIRVESCEVAECGAGGIYVGGRNSVIRDNHVHGIGRFYPSAVGIFRGGQMNTVSHNEVHDCSYSAINYGGDRNMIEDNLLYDCMKVLHDGAAIYLFAGENCVIRRNLTRDMVDTGGYGASAYYLDEQSRGCLVENNVSFGVAWPSHNHMATNNTIRNNIFVAAGDLKITFPRSASFTFTKNVLCATGAICVENPDAVTNWSQNVFHSLAGKIEAVRLQDYTRLDTFEFLPGHSLAADPLFLNWEKGDLRYRPDSPAVELGIKPINTHNAGPTSR